MELKEESNKRSGGGTSKERGASNLEIVTWISVVLVIAVALFVFRDNISKFITGVSVQITGEVDDGRNEYGFYYGKIYQNEDGTKSFFVREDGTACYTEQGVGWASDEEFDSSEVKVNQGSVQMGGKTYSASSDGKSFSDGTTTYYISN